MAPHIHLFPTQQIAALHPDRKLNGFYEHFMAAGLKGTEQNVPVIPTQMPESGLSIEAWGNESVRDEMKTLIEGGDSRPGAQNAKLVGAWKTMSSWVDKLKTEEFNTDGNADVISKDEIIKLRNLEGKDSATQNKAVTAAYQGLFMFTQMMNLMADPAFQIRVNINTAKASAEPAAEGNETAGKTYAHAQEELKNQVEQVIEQMKLHAARVEGEEYATEGVQAKAETNDQARIALLRSLIANDATYIDSDLQSHIRGVFDELEIDHQGENACVDPSSTWDDISQWAGATTDSVREVVREHPLTAGPALGLMVLLGVAGGVKGTKWTFNKTRNALSNRKSTRVQLKEAKSELSGLKTKLAEAEKAFAGEKAGAKAEAVAQLHDAIVGAEKTLGSTGKGSLTNRRAAFDKLVEAFERLEVLAKQEASFSFGVAEQAVQAPKPSRINAIRRGVADFVSPDKKAPTAGASGKAAETVQPKPQASEAAKPEIKAPEAAKPEVKAPEVIPGEVGPTS